jgi:hypothetical protein
VAPAARDNADSRAETADRAEVAAVVSPTRSAALAAVVDRGAWAAWGVREALEGRVGEAAL